MIANVLWDAKGVILLDFLPKLSTITGEYCTSFLDQLRIQYLQKDMINSIKKILFSKTMQVYTCKISMDAVDRKKYEIKPHLPDLAPNDYFFFPNFKRKGNMSVDAIFRSDKEVVNG